MGFIFPDSVHEIRLVPLDCDVITGRVWLLSLLIRNEGPRFTIKGKSYVGTANTPVLGDSPYALFLFPQLHNGDKVFALCEHNDFM